MVSGTLFVPGDLVADFVTALPKAELHLHVEGTLEPELAFTLAARNAVALPFPDVASPRRAYQFSDLQSFLDLYYACMAVLRTEEDFRDLAAAYLTRARADGVVRAEMFFDPQAHLDRGVPLASVIAGLTRAAREAELAGGPTVGLIACLLRDHGPASAVETVEALAGYRDALTGIGLDSAEVGYPPANYAAAFELAGQLGLRKVAHPLPVLLDAGVHVTINSDDLAYFGGYVADNYRAVADAFGLGEPDLRSLAAASMAACFPRP
jgi:adenine deaminase